MLKQISNRIKEKAGTKEGVLILLVVLWVLNAFLLNGLATDYFGQGGLLQGLFAFLSFTILGLLTVAIVKLTRHLINIKIQDSALKQDQSHDESRQSRTGAVTDNDKISENIQTTYDQVPSESNTKNFIFIRSEGKIIKILFDSLLYAEASGNYTKIILENTTLHPTMTFGNLEEILPKKTFLRVHRSFIVNKSKINHIEGNRVFIGKTEIPIGANYKQEFLKEIGV